MPVPGLLVLDLHRGEAVFGGLRSPIAPGPGPGEIYLGRDPGAPLLGPVGFGARTWAVMMAYGAADPRAALCSHLAAGATRVSGEADPLARELLALYLAGAAEEEERSYPRVTLILRAAGWSVEEIDRMDALAADRLSRSLAPDEEEPADGWSRLLLAGPAGAGAADLRDELADRLLRRGAPPKASAEAPHALRAAHAAWPANESGWMRSPLPSAGVPAFSLHPTLAEPPTGMSHGPFLPARDAEPLPARMPAPSDLGPAAPEGASAGAGWPGAASVACKLPGEESGGGSEPARQGMPCDAPEDRVPFRPAAAETVLLPRTGVAREATPPPRQPAAPTARAEAVEGTATATFPRSGFLPDLPAWISPQPAAPLPGAASTGAGWGAAAAADLRTAMREPGADRCTRLPASWMDELALALQDEADLRGLDP